MNKYLDIAVKAAVAAGDIIIKGLHKKKVITYKSRIDPVTHIDKECERVITGLIRKNFPGHSILAEETGSNRVVSDYCWVIDPLDGTVNYAHGFPSFCCCIALTFKDRVIAGVTYDPQRGELFKAAKGRGAYLNGKKIRVSNISRLDRSLLATGFSYNIKNAKNKNIRSFRSVSLHCQGVRRAGSAGLDLAYVACGRLDGFWEYNLNPWDVGSGALLITEAGGRMSNIYDNGFSIFSKQTMASNGILHAKLKKIVNLKG